MSATYEERVNSPAVRDMFAGHIDALNARNPTNGNRSVVSEMNKHVLDAIYT